MTKETQARQLADLIISICDLYLLYDPEDYIVYDSSNNEVKEVKNEF